MQPLPKVIIVYTISEKLSSSEERHHRNINDDNSVVCKKYMFLVLNVFF